MKLNGSLEDNCLRGGQKKCCRSRAGSLGEGPQVCSRGQRAAGSDLSGEASSLMRELSLGSVEPNVTCGVDKVLCISLQENVNSLFLILKFVTHFKAEKLRCDSMMPLCKKKHELFMGYLTSLQGCVLRNMLILTDLSISPTWCIVIIKNGQCKSVHNAKQVAVWKLDNNV